MTLKYIFHLSDLHIRTCDKLYCRHYEYLLILLNNYYHYNVYY